MTEVLFCRCLGQIVLQCMCCRETFGPVSTIMSYSTVVRSGASLLVRMGTGTQDGLRSSWAPATLLHILQRITMDISPVASLETGHSLLCSRVRLEVILCISDLSITCQLKRLTVLDVSCCWTESFHGGRAG